MNFESTSDSIIAAAVADAPELAHCAAFHLGTVEVVPALCELHVEGHPPLRLQPLAMRVLLALASAHPGTCSRDDLLQSCWPQRIVGDDAVHRVISTLRRDLERASGGAVGIETIAKVGYRLRAPEGGGDGAARTGLRSSWASSSWRRRAMFAAGMLLLGAAVLAAMSWMPSADASGFTVGVEPVLSDVDDREASRFASGVTEDMARFAGAASRIDLVDRSMTGNKPTDLIVRVAVERDGDALAARARLVDTAEGTVLFSREFRDESGDVGRLRDRTSIGLAGVISCGLDRSARAYGDAALKRLYFTACDAIQSEDPARAEGLVRELVQRRPDIAAGWACLAQLTLGKESDAGGEGRALLATVRRYAERAIRLDPNSGRGYAALALSWGDLDPRALEVIEKGIRADPEYVSLHAVYATSLFNGGYVKQSVQTAQRALALNPASRYYYGLAVRRLLAIGRIDEAFAVQKEAERFFPESPEVLEHRIRLLPYWRDAAKALAVFERSPAYAGESGGGRELKEIELRWRADPRSLDLAELDRVALAGFAESPSSAWYVAALMTRLGQTERALAWLARAPRQDAHSQWSLLFWPEVAPLRRDPRFFKAMAELGLVDLWLKRGQWPDFCSEPGLRYDCRTEAARLGQRTA